MHLGNFVDIENGRVGFTILKIYGNATFVIMGNYYYVVCKTTDAGREIDMV